jgi:hypothetical protein
VEKTLDGMSRTSGRNIPIDAAECDISEGADAEKQTRSLKDNFFKPVRHEGLGELLQPKRQGNLDSDAH